MAYLHPKQEVLAFSRIDFTFSIKFTYPTKSRESSITIEHAISRSGFFKLASLAVWAVSSLHFVVLIVVKGLEQQLLEKFDALHNFQSMCNRSSG